jgi:uncharacterized OB-fold protein
MQPPSVRSRVALGLNAGALKGRFELQVCQKCATVQYPPREACHECLSVELQWQPVDGSGELLAQTRLHHSQHDYFADKLPWRVGTIRLDCGPMVIAHLADSVLPPPSRVYVAARVDQAGNAVLIAAGEGGITGKLAAEFPPDLESAP